MSKQERGNAYWAPRLQRERPAIYADWKAGKYRSLRQALLAADLKKQSSPLNELKSAWSKANHRQRSDFLRWAKINGPGSNKVVGFDGRLLVTVATRIEEIRTKRSLTIGDMMQEMGFSGRDGSLGYALNNNSIIRPKLALALREWLKNNRQI